MIFHVAYISLYCYAWLSAFIAVFRGKFDTYHHAMKKWSVMVLTLHCNVMGRSVGKLHYPDTPEWALKSAYKHADRTPDDIKKELGICKELP